MSRFLGIAAALLVVFLATAFAAANVGHRVTLSLGLFTLYRVPVSLVAFSGLLVGMLVMFATGVHSDLKVRRILRERLAEESRKEQGWIDRNQRDLFAQDPEVGAAAPESEPPPRPNAEVLSVPEDVPNPILAPLPIPPSTDADPGERERKETASHEEGPSSQGPEEEPKTE
ncbi:MAG: hypothetical protein ACWGSQ_19250 [Longimicrobiales bacterium]